MSKFSHFRSLRAKGVRLMKAAEMANIDVLRGIAFAAAIVAVLAFVGLIQDWSEKKADERAAQHKKFAEENMAAFNRSMKGLPFLIDGGAKMLLTCPAIEAKL